MPAKTKEAVKTGAMFGFPVAFGYYDLHGNPCVGASANVKSRLKRTHPWTTLETFPVLVIPADKASVAALREKIVDKIRNPATLFVEVYWQSSADDILEAIGLPLPASTKRAGKGRGLK